MKWKKKRNGSDKKYATADKWFSRYIRLRDTDEHGYCICVTCSKRTAFEQIDCGHAEERWKIGTRFDERNSHGQCRSCNRFMGGEKQMHLVMIEKKHGKSALNEVLAKSRSTMKLLPFEVKEISAEYRERAREEFKKKSDWFQTMHENLIK